MEIPLSLRLKITNFSHSNSSFVGEYIKTEKRYENRILFTIGSDLSNSKSATFFIPINPNTVRLYEKLKLIPKPERLSNGYRVFTEFHIKQCRLIRLAFQVEVLQNGLRKKIAQMITVSATGDFDTAIALTKNYLEQVGRERRNAEEAIEVVKQILSGGIGENFRHLKRKDVSKLLDISMDTLRKYLRHKKC